MAIYNYKKKKKAFRKKLSKKKAVKKKAKKKVKITSKEPDSGYKIGIENWEHELILSHRMVDEIRNKFEIGDIFSIGESYEWEDDGKVLFDTYYKYGKDTDAPFKYEVVWKDKWNIPHYRRIESDGSYGVRIWSLLESYSDSTRWGVMSEHDELTLDQVYPIDQGYVDATIMGVKYDPLTDYKDKCRQLEEEDKSKVEDWYRIVASNRKLRLYTGSDRYLNSMKKKYKMGDVVHHDAIGDMTFRLIEDDIIVMVDSSGKAHTYSNKDLKNHKFYKSAPMPLPNIYHIDKKQRVAWKPEDL